MHYLIIVGFIMIFAAVVLWTLAVKIDEEVSVVIFLFSIIFFALSVYLISEGVKSDTSEEVLKYLIDRNVIELQVDKKTNEINYVITPKADSTGWRPLYFYLKEGLK